ncbi:MAG TPA: Wzy polymerase domain-containing protein, partial [Burkholderiales bacterium]|nr:Wzy polymerase domain-containing protein [Burkholderiales bacterium]
HYHFDTPFYAFVTPDSAETVYGNLAQQNHFSDYISLSLASLLYLSARQKIPAFLAAPMGIFQLFTLALSGSRSSWLFLGAMTLLALFQFRKEKALLFGALFLLPTFALMQFAAHLSILDSVGATTSADRLLVIARDSGIRFYLWHEAWLMFLKAPLLGTGFGQFAWHHFCYGPILGHSEITGLYTNSHDIFLNFLAETGLIGSLLLFGGLFFWAKRTTLPFDIHAWWLYSLLLVMALHSLDEYPLWYAQFLGIFMLLLGLGESRALQLPLAQGIAALLLASGSYLMTGVLLDYLHLEALLYPGYHSGKPPLRGSVLFDSLYRASKGTLLAPYVEYPLAEM